MAVDKLVDSAQLDADLEDIADAIRAKGGTSASLAFPNDFVSAIENIPTGGGGAITLLDTITVSEQVRALNIDITPYSSYDTIFIFADITLTASDWLYVARNGSSPSGGSYSESASRLKGLLYVRGTTACGRAGWTDALTNYTGMVGGNSIVTNLYVYTYTASKFITAGSKFYIYGGTYADILQ